MSEPTKEAIERAWELLNFPFRAVNENDFASKIVHDDVMNAARFIQEVSDASREARDDECCHTMDRFILPDPEPDVLAEALMGLVPVVPEPHPGESHAEAMARKLSSELAKRGHAITKVAS